MLIQAGDLTREVLAVVAGVDLVEDAESLAQIEAMYRARNRVMPDRNRVQALCPRGAAMIVNPSGTAPGVWLEHAGTVYAVKMRKSLYTEKMRFKAPRILLRIFTR